MPGNKLTNCPDCEGAVSPMAFSCPHCGRPLKSIVDEWTAKRRKVLVMTYLMLVILGLVLVAIGVLTSKRVLTATGGTISAFGALNTYVFFVVLFFTRK